ncbi:MAG: leucine--tRNA ligase [Candidatus Palauibacterales bacterium]|nr:leucine--tRNA ligase [Candidatus Palauibacterales bacterium]
MTERESMYDPQKIEEKWQRRWREERADEPDLDAPERPFYNLMMYPYPSAEGLHVGNLYAFTGADLYGRYRRLRGDEVFQPIGFDAFGIHSENYALKVDTHPMELIPSNIRNFTRQLHRAGIMYDWAHAVDTTDPGYYRWTQWIFLQLYEAGLAEKKEAPVNWCPSCKTVLANEQVIAGACERCGTPVGTRFLSQWFFRITEYAGRLLDDLDWIDWSETTKTAQRNWIGRSEGALLRFPVSSPPATRAEVAGEAGRPAGVEDAAIEVFTTRPDTVFGASFMVLAPEHPLVDRLTTDERRAEVEAYRRQVAATDLVQRQKTDRAKTGVFTGGTARNPATGREVPVWIADYVLMEYGTGAIMAVPAHDQRDFEFARAFGLPIPVVVAPREVAEAADDPADVAIEAGQEALADTGDVRLVNSGKFSGLRPGQGAMAIIEWLAAESRAEPRVQYRLHDWCISRQRYWGPPIPIIYCDACGTVPVPEEDLPVELPWVEHFRPDDEGLSPLARVESFYRTRCPRCGGEARRETDVSDTFLDSAWYFMRYPSTDFTDRAFDEARTERWLPVDMYIGGEEHAVLHLLYSRFVTMVLHDAGFLAFEEPYERFRKHGLLIKEGAKMSKSRGNVVVPDAYMDQHGADVFRAYLMFLGPYQEGGDFRDEGIVGIERFLARLWDSVHEAIEAGAEGFPDAAVERKVHRTIRQVTDDFERLSYNTAIAALMECLNELRAGGRTPTLDEVRPLLVMAAPVVPHLGEELWEKAGDGERLFASRPNGGELAREVWPAYDPDKLHAAQVEIPVQVNGKVRGTVRVERGASQEAVQRAALEDDNVRRHVEGASIRHVVHVPDRLLNLVVEG